MSNKPQYNQNEPKKPSKDAVILLVSLILCTMAVLAVYRFMIGFPFFRYVLFAYISIETVLIAVYVIYNRGFSRKGITEDMLPLEWSPEKRREFVESAAARQKKSRWMLIPIFAFFFTFAVDALELFVLPFIEELFL